MIADLLKSKIEEYARHAASSNALFVAASEGKLTEREVGRYLANVKYLIQHTPVYLLLASREAEKKGLPELRRFYRSKLGEEAGHEKWAENDLVLIEKLSGVEPPKDVVPSMRALVKYLKTTIEKDPILYLPYIMLAEYFTVLVAPAFLKNLRKPLRHSSKVLSVIGNHAELDKGHVRDNVREINALIPASTYERPFLEVLGRAMKLYNDFCEEVGGTDGKRDQAAA